MIRLSLIAICAAFAVTRGTSLPEVPPQSGKMNCAGMNMRTCLNEYTDSAWFWDPMVDVRKWAAAVWAADINMATGKCAELAEEVGQAIDGMKSAFSS